MKKLLFLLITVITLSACEESFTKVEKTTPINYEITQIVANQPESMDSVQLIETEQYHYIVKDNVIIYQYNTDVNLVPVGSMGILLILCITFFVLFIIAASQI